MARGGKRRGAGRKPGVITIRTSEIAAAEAEAGKLTPLEYILGVMRDQKAPPERRDAMAFFAAPYMHARQGFAIPQPEQPRQIEGVVVFHDFVPERMLKTGGGSA